MHPIFQELASLPGSQNSGADRPIIVFVGPSIPPSSVRNLLPAADVRPPIRRGDLAPISGPATVAIIDGVFDSELAVTPSEIRAAIERGICVAGSSSMGALRAAEVHEMIGVGRVYEMYRNGLVVRDDEVAVLIDADTGRALTDPLVNVRFAVETLVAAGTLNPRKAALILEAASALHFHDRMYRHILRKAGLAEMEGAEELISALKAIDLKREDAHTLLERLPAMASQSFPPADPAALHYPNEELGVADSIRCPESATADAAVMVWEFGESISWPDLIIFLALTGKFATHARSTIERAGYDEAEFKIPGTSQLPAESVQELFTEVMAQWGWKSSKEVHTTLADLGIGTADLQEHLRQERRSRQRIRTAFALHNEAFMRSLRLDLLTTDLALKRESMRFGALMALATIGRIAGNPLMEAERENACRAILCARPELSWQGVLHESGLRDEEAAPVVDLIAFARRAGGSLLSDMEGAPSKSGWGGTVIPSMPLAAYVDEAGGRSLSESRAAEIARGLGHAIGVTRVAQLGELERFGVHVAAAYRASKWSSTIGSGKSSSPEGAIAGALMEELEKFCLEMFEADRVADGPYSEVRRAHKVADPGDCALPFDSCYSPDVPLTWSWMTDLLSGDRIFVPAAMLSIVRQKNDVLYSPRRSGRIFSTNGVASGFTLTEAIVHALCELIERHSTKLAQQAISNPGDLPQIPSRFSFVHLSSAPASTQLILSGIRAAGFEARVMNITSEITVPTFAVRVFRPAALHGLDEPYASGFCAHPNPEIALNRALLEAIQTRVGAVAGAREDFAISVRSLGKHERPEPLSRGDAYWVRPYVPKVRWSGILGCAARDGRESLDYVVRRITAAGFDTILFRELSGPSVAPAHVVRALVPGMEDTNPFYTGPRARTQIVCEFMRGHEW